MSEEIFWFTKVGVRVASRKIWLNIYIIYIYSTHHSPPALAALPPCSFPASEPWQKMLFSCGSQTSYSQVAFSLSNGHIPQIFLGVQSQASKPESPEAGCDVVEENCPWSQPSSWADWMARTVYMCKHGVGSRNGSTNMSQLIPSWHKRLHFNWNGLGIFKNV